MADGIHCALVLSRVASLTRFGVSAPRSILKLYDAAPIFLVGTATVVISSVP